MRLLDTDVCVEILRGNQGVISRRRAVTDAVVTSWITASELFYGAAKSSSPAENTRLVTQFLGTLQIVPMGLSASQLFGKVKSDLERAGQRLADADLLIGSICLARAAVLVTGNRRHYQRIPGLAIEDWIRG